MASSGPSPPLTATERAIIESIRRGAPDAEIAARLGITIGEVKSRVEALQMRFGRAERSALATVDVDREMGATVSRERPEAPTGSENTASPPDPLRDMPEDSQDTEQTYSRRALLGMMGVGAATLAGVGAYYLTSRDGSPAPARPDPFATNTPPPAASPPPTSTPHPGATLIEPVDDAFEVLLFARNEAIDVDHGICFMDTAMGAVTCYRLAESGFDMAPFYDASPENRFISAFRFGDRQFVFDRNAGTAFAWPTGELALVALGDRRILVREMHGSSGAGDPNPGDRLLVLDTEMGQEQAVSLKVTRVGAGGPRIYPRTAAQAAEGLLAQDSGLAEHHFLEGRLSPDESEYAVLTRHQGMMTVSLIDLDRRTVIVLMAVSSSDDGIALLSGLEWLDERRFSFVLTERLAPGNGSPSRSPDDTTQQRLVYDPRTGIQAFGPLIGGAARAQFSSPDGTSIAHTYWLREVYADMMLDGWPAIVVSDGAGQPRFQVKSASMAYGDMFDGTRWLADSSAIVALVQDEGANAYRYALVDAENGELTYLPPLRASGDHWWSHPMTFAPMPSPDRPNLFSVGRTALFDLETGDFVAPPIPEDGPTHLSPWGVNATEMRFAFPHLGHGGPGTPTLLTPAVDFPPLDRSLRFVVARSETCLNLRSGPSLEADILTCLPDGTPLELAPPEDGSPEPTPGPGGLPAGEPFPGLAVHVNWEDDIRYARVRTEEGRTGWVAVQYLDWAE